MEGELKSVKSMLRSVLLSSKDGVQAARLQRDYKEIVGDFIPFKKLGYQTFEQFILSIPDVTRLERKGGEVIIHGVADASTSHIKALVSKQRNKKLKKPIRRPRGGGYASTNFLARPFERRKPGAYKPVYHGTPGQHVPRYGIPSFISPPLAKPLTPVTISIRNTATGTRTIRLGTSAILQRAMSDANNDRLINRPQSSKFEIPPRFLKKMGGSPTSPIEQHPVDTTPVQQPQQHKPEPTTREDGETHIGILSQHLRDMNEALEFHTTATSCGYVSSVRVKLSTFGSGEIFNTAKEAEAAAARNAITELRLENLLKENRLPLIDWNETANQDTVSSSLSREKQMKIKSRIKEILRNKKNGLWGTRIPYEYKEKYKEDPPAHLMELLNNWTDIVKIELIPNTDRAIVFPVQQDPNMNLEIGRENLISMSEEVTVYMTYICNPGYFCVQREDSVIEDIIEGLQTHCKSMSGPPIHQMKSGRYCAAVYSGDSSWTRAQILQHNDNDMVELLFIDYGNVECAKVDDVRWLSPDLVRHPYQAINCSLSGIQPLEGEKNWSTAASELFAAKVQEQALIAVPQEICDNMIEVLLYLKSDTSESINEMLLRAGVVLPTKVLLEDDNLHPADLVLPDEKEWDVHVTFISSSTESVMLRLVGDDYSDKLDSYQTKLQEAFRNSSSETPINEGVTYIAYDDELYHRVRVISHEGNKIQCYFLDHGDTDELIPEQLHPIDPQINKLLPYQAVEVSLYGLEEVSNNITALEKICDLALGKTCVAEVIDREALPSVILFDTSADNDLNINATILRTIEVEGGGIGTPTTAPPCPGASASSTPQRMLSPSPSSDDVGSIVVASPEPSTREVKSSVIASPEPSTSNVKSSAVTSLEPSTGEVKSSDIASPEPSTRQVKFSDIASPEPSTGEVKSSDIASPEPSTRQVKSSDIASPEPSSGEVKSNVIASPEPSTNDVRSSDIASLESSTGDVRSIAVTSPEPSTRQVKFSDIASPEPSTRQVKSSDIGDSRSVENTNSNNSIGRTVQYSLKPLTNAHNNLPNVSQNLELSANLDTRLDSDITTKSKSSELLDTVANMEQQNFSRPILGRSPNGKGVVDTLTNDNEFVPQPFQIPAVGEYLDVHINFVRDPSNFVCIPYDEMNNLNQLLLDMMDFYSGQLQTMVKSDIQIGKLYAGHKDGVWYRVKVSTSVGIDLVSVFMVDIGEYTVISEIQPLAQQFRRLPLMAINATLGNILPESGSWFESAKYKFIELAREKDLVGLIQGQDESTGVVDLRLIDTSKHYCDVCIDEVLVKLEYAKLK